MNRLSAEPKQRRSLPVIDQRVAAMTDFNTLPGMSEISVQRAFGNGGRDQQSVFPSA
jgi:hypothetical protein